MRFSLHLLVGIMLLLGLPPMAQAQGLRYALVIGNGNYADMGKLKNPANDATDIAAALGHLGFKVTLITDASRKDMNQALNDFHDTLAQDSGSDGFFWYAGHGVQSKGENYLIPVGADIRREADLEDEAVSVRRLNSLLDDARNRVNIVVLDACRNNPIPSMGRSGARGLTVASLAPAESIIMYSTGAGQIAQDGNGNRNSPFAQAFLKYIAQGGDITATIKAITAETKRLTSGAQIPYLYSSLTRDFAMNSKTQAASANTYENSEQRKAPTISITREYGSLEVRAEKAGQLYLDGVKIVDIAERIKVTLNDIEVGNRTLEIRYKDGEKEQRNVAVAKERTAIIYFAFQRTKIPAVTISGMTLNRNPMAFTISTAPNPPSQTAQLIAEVSPSEASQKVSWTSSNPTAATVSSSGVVTAISVGSAKITAMASDNKTTADCFVTIWQIDENGFVRYYCNDAACYGHAIGMGSLGSANNTRLTATAANPFAFQVKKVSGSSGQGYGIQFCGNGRTSYYRFTIATNGQYRFQKSVEGKMTDLVHWTNSNAIIRGDNKVNTISTWQPAAGEISISINGTIVIDKFSDSTFSTGFLSVYASNASPNSSIPDNFPAIPEDIRYKVTSPFAYPSLSND